MTAYSHSRLPFGMQVVQTWLAKDRRPSDAHFGHSIDMSVVTGETSGPERAQRDSAKAGSVERVEAMSGVKKWDELDHKSSAVVMGDGVLPKVLSEIGVEDLAKERLPINEIVHFHNAIRKELEGFAEEARALRLTGMLNAVSLTSLVERYRSAIGLSNLEHETHQLTTFILVFLMSKLAPGKVQEVTEKVKSLVNCWYMFVQDGCRRLLLWRGNVRSHNLTFRGRGEMTILGKGPGTLLEGMMRQGVGAKPWVRTKRGSRSPQ